MNRANIKIPISDFLPLLKSSIFDKWQSSWNNESDCNKLKQLKPNVRMWHSSVQKVRHIEVILSRLRIGHTRLTHGYLTNIIHLTHYLSAYNVEQLLVLNIYCASVQILTDKEQ